MSSSITRRELYRNVTNSDPIVLVEALGPGFFADAHIPGAVNIPPDLVDVLAPHLIEDFSATVVVYCSGTCQNSEIVANRLKQLGYSNVRVYPGGKEDWVEAGLPIDRSAESD